MAASCFAVMARVVPKLYIDGIKVLSYRFSAVVVLEWFLVPWLRVGSFRAGPTILSGAQQNGGCIDIAQNVRMAVLFFRWYDNFVQKMDEITWSACPRGLGGDFWSV